MNDEYQKNLDQILSLFVDPKNQTSLAYLSLTNQTYYQKYYSQRVKHLLNLEIQKIKFPRFGTGFWKKVFPGLSDEDRMDEINKIKYWHVRADIITFSRSKLKKAFNEYLEWFFCDFNLIISNDMYMFYGIFRHNLKYNDSNIRIIKSTHNNHKNNELIEDILQKFYVIDN